MSFNYGRVDNSIYKGNLNSRPKSVRNLGMSVLSISDEYHVNWEALIVTSILSILSRPLL